MKRKKLRNSRGFTFVEILIAVSILATGLVLIIEGMARSQQAVRASEYLVLASQALEERATESQVEARKEGALDPKSDGGIEEVPGRTIHWQRHVEVYKDDLLKQNFSVDTPDLNKLNVSLNWVEGVRQNHWDLNTFVMNREKK